MFRVMFTDDEKANKKITRWVGVGTLMIMLGGAISWVGGVWDKTIDPLNTTHAEAKAFDKESMETHMEEVSVTPYAMQNDVAHIANMMVDEQVCDAEAEVDAYEDAEAAGSASAVDTLDKTRKEDYIKRRKKAYVQDGHNDHGDCK